MWAVRRMLRAAAKNHAIVTVVCDPADYDAVADELSGEARTTTLETRRRLAAKAFARTAAYNSAIAAWFASLEAEASSPAFSIAGSLKQALRYGENPHQQAALYQFGDHAGPSIVGAEQAQGKELSYNNLTDADAAFELISEFPAEEPAVAIVKHANPCGAAVGASLTDAYRKALACDPVSAFGGIVALNAELDEEAAREILKIFTEVVIAPSATPEARKAFASKANVRLLLTGGLLPSEKRGALLSARSPAASSCRTPIRAGSTCTRMRTVTKREPSPEERANMVFAMRVCKHVKSNAIVFAKDGATAGIGAGQMSRVDSVRLAVWKAREVAAAAQARPGAGAGGHGGGFGRLLPFRGRPAWRRRMRARRPSSSRAAPCATRM